MIRLKQSIAWLSLPLLSIAATAAQSSNEVSSPRFWLARLVAMADQTRDLKLAANEYAAIAPLQARARDLAGMRRSLQKVRAAESGSGARERFYLVMAELESYARAKDEQSFRARLDELRKMRESDPKGFNNHFVVTRLCDLGRLDDALVWAALPASPDPRWWYLSIVAGAQAKAGQRDACGRTLDMAEADADRATRDNPGDGDYDWNGLASVAASAGDAKRLAHLAVHLKGDTAASDYARLAVAEWEAGNRAACAADMKKAFQLAVQGDPHGLGSCYGTIARAQAAICDPAGVTATEAAFPVGPDISSQTIKLQGFYQDMATAYAILGDENKVADRLKKAREIVGRANDAGKSLQEPLDNLQSMMAPLYPPILVALARKGKIDAAAKLAADAPPSQRDGAMIALAMVYAQIGRTDDAVQLLKTRDADEIRFTLFLMGKAIGRSGKLGGWLNYVDGLKSAEDRANASLGAAEGLLDRAEGKP